MTLPCQRCGHRDKEYRNPLGYIRCKAMHNEEHLIHPVKDQFCPIGRQLEVPK